MTYKEMEEQLGHNIEVSMDTTVGMASWLEIDGRYWVLIFDLTDEQTKKIRNPNYIEHYFFYN